MALLGYAPPKDSMGLRDTMDTRGLCRGMEGTLEHFGSIPDCKLPEPWSCNWRAWGLLPYWRKPRNTGPMLHVESAVETMLSEQLDISDLNPLMFRSGRTDNTTTVFVGKNWPTYWRNPGPTQGSWGYYLYDAPTQNVYRFDGVESGQFLPSVFDFLQRADWNMMTHLASVGSTNIGPAALTSGPPLVLHGLHNAETPWGYEERVVRAPFLEQSKKIDAAVRDWCAIPDAYLPSPWSCDWSNWHGWCYGPELLQDSLCRLYHIAGSLNPIMFRRFLTTVFEARGVFYLFGPAFWDREEHGRHHHFYRFPGSYSSVEAFLENCDWNGMEEMECISPSDRIAASVEPCLPLPLTESQNGLRLASIEPYRKRNLMATLSPKGTWGYLPRRYERCGLELLSDPRIATWPAIPDEQLPAPFTCDWTAFSPVDNWFDIGIDGSQIELRHRWGVPDLTPVMFMSHSRFDCRYHLPTVLRAEGKYYFWRWEDDPYDDWLREFEGSYESVEDFIQNADWNKLSGRMVENENWYEELRGTDSDSVNTATVELGRR
ncbi:hypothetical protein C8J57DRAFT_1467814 [Mycena rebaudengoi]|nr:hypothetical protein C8J57DRAFT_1467814 [Mycena rebaudengoi]